MDPFINVLIKLLKNLSCPITTINGLSNAEFHDGSEGYAIDIEILCDHPVERLGALSEYNTNGLINKRLKIHATFIKHMITTFLSL